MGQSAQRLFSLAGRAQRAGAGPALAGAGRWSPESASHEKTTPLEPRAATGARRGHPHRSRTHDPTHPTPTPTPNDEQLTYTFDDRHWRVRGLEKQLSCERLRVNLLVSRRELVHVDTLDLYAARARRAFLQEAAAELFVEEATLKQDLGHIFLDLELRQDALDPRVWRAGGRRRRR